MKLAIVSGTSIERSELLEGLPQQLVETQYGKATLLRSGDSVVLNRHGFGNPAPPHAINYRANIEALCSLGVDTVLSINSVGSLDPAAPPGTLVSCSDYVSFAPITFIDDQMSGFMPVVENKLIDSLEEKLGRQILRGKIYAQTRGPRFETRAEVKILQSLGCDVVGMTFAHEADLLLERGISVNSLCMIDNLAHGVEGEELTMDKFRLGVAGNQATIDAALKVALAIGQE